MFKFLKKKSSCCDIKIDEVKKEVCCSTVEKKESNTTEKVSS